MAWRCSGVLPKVSAGRPALRPGCRWKTRDMGLNARWCSSLRQYGCPAVPDICSRAYPPANYYVSMTGDEPSTGIAAVSKACKVLRAFSPTVGSLSVRQVAARADLPRSTAHDLCRTLVAEGMLDAGGSGYRLGPMLLELAGQIILRTGLVRASEGVLDRLVRAPEQEAHLGQLLNGWVVYLDRNSGTRRVPMQNNVGQRAPAHLTGCGKAALSWLPFDTVAHQVEKCCAESRIPLPDLRDLEAELRTARQDGYIVSRTFQRDRTSVAAPIFGSAGEPLGGISLAGPSSMFSAAVLAAARASVMDAAGLTSSRLISASRIDPTVHR